MPTPRPFARLRGELRAMGIDGIYLADAIHRTEQYVSSRMTAKAPWTADEMYLIMGEINWPPERMHELFPPRAKQKTIRSRKP